MGIVGEVPRHEHEIRPFLLLRQLLHGLHLSPSGSKIVRFQFFEQIVDAFGRLRHSFFQHIVGIARKTEQLRHLHAEIHQLFADLKVVARIVVRTTGHVGTIHALSQCTIFGILHERSERRCMKREDPALQLALCSRGGRLFNLRLRQTRQIFALRQMQHEVVGLFDVVLRELQRELSQFRLHLLESAAFFLGKRGSRTHKTIVRILQKHGILAGERGFPFFLFVDRAHSAEEGLIERDACTVFTQDGRHLLGQLFQFVGGVGRKLVVHERCSAFQHFAGVAECHNRVAKARFVGRSCNGVHLSAFNFYAFQQGSLDVGHRDVGKREGIVRGSEFMLE